MLRAFAIATALPFCLGGASAPPTVAPRPTSATWTLTWDDSCDLELDRTDKVCHIALAAVDGHVTGAYVGPVLGEERNAIFTGEALADGTVVTLVQREPDYACTYQLARKDRGVLVGTWLDTLGRCGTAVLRTEPGTTRRRVY